MVTIKSSFEEILGKTQDQYTESERRNRWEQWKECCREKKNNENNMIDYWTDTSGCEGCIHLDKHDAWCNLVGLPCTVNPILSFRYACSGMACMGVGKEKNKQLELFQ